MGIKDRWDKACAESIGSFRFWGIAVDHLSIVHQLAPLIERYAHGRILDAGAGRMAWRGWLEPRATQYIAMDYADTHPDLAFQADLRDPLPLDEDSIDTIFCCSVLEHIPEPWLALPQLRRVLCPGGYVILSVPFLYYLHGAPHDYFRFTSFGITELATRAGFEIVESKSGGGIAHTILHSVSMVLTALLWHRRLPWMATMPAHGLFAVARAVDAFDTGGLFAQTVNFVLRRPTADK